MFWSQVGLRIAEFSDAPLRLPPNEETYHDIFKAKHVTKYLDDYVDDHVYSGKSLRDRIIFDFPVSNITKIGDIWIISRKSATEGSTPKVRARRLMVASGMTSEPNMPVLPQSITYKGLLIHQKDFGQSSVLSSLTVERIVVLGAGKSAADMVYAAAKAGKTVSWVIRKSGTGPPAFIDIKGRGAYKNASEIGHTRLMVTMAPSCFTEPTLLSRFVHESRLGRLIGRKVWRNADRDIHQEANYHRRSGALKGYEKLEPSSTYVLQFSIVA